MTTRQVHTFYPRVVNKSNIPFSETEMTLLQKGLKYNLHTKCRDWLKNLALEAETAVSHLPIADRDVYRKLVAERITTLHQNSKHPPTPNTQQETKSIQSKLQSNNATITRADKGNTLVIIPTEQYYDSKMQDFIKANNLLSTPTDPTKTYQTSVRKTINSSKTLIPQDTRWKYINMNPSAPTIKGLIKLHKQDQPIRPVVNWRNAPAYKLAQLFTKKVGHVAPPT